MEKNKTTQRNLSMGRKRELYILGEICCPLGEISLRDTGKRFIVPFFFIKIMLEILEISKSYCQIRRGSRN